MAAGMASHGAKIAICSRNSDEAKATAKEIADEFGVETFGLECDVTSPEAVDAMVKQITDTLGTVNVLVNNAGINIRVRSTN